MWKFKRIIEVVKQTKNIHTTHIKHIDKCNFNISEEVRFALETHKPVVALESTIITHGMPYPDNLKCAIEVENIIRKQGAIPATIAILGGKVTVGLNNNQLSELADLKTTKSIKTSRRDLSYVVSQELNGGTTVSGTIVIAEKVGIPIFVTGGIGGVHREGEKTFDISADLTELGRSSIAVVSSGVKSILDIPKTLEFLETQGVFVATFGLCDFPAFYTRESGYKAPYNITKTSQAAEIIHSSFNLGLKSGMLFAVPIPAKNALDQNIMQQVIGEALKEADEKGIKGKGVTPFLLEKVKDLTKGKSLEANMALIKNNAQVGADIAVELSKLRNPISYNTAQKGSPLVIGGCVVDLLAKIHNPDNVKLDGSMHYTKFSTATGGVGRNMYEALTKLGKTPEFISAVGDDKYGDQIRSNISTKSIKTIRNNSTAQCTVIFDSSGNCKLLLGDMDVFNKITPEMIKDEEDLFKQSPLIVIDGNIPTETVSYVLELAEKYNKPVFYEPTDVPVAAKPFHSTSKSLKFISPNLNELKFIANYLNITIPEEKDVVKQAATLGKLVANYVDTLFVTLGSLGLLVIRRATVNEPLLNPVNTTNDIKVRYYKTEEVKELVNVSGSGDCLASGIITAMLKGKSEATCISVGLAAAKMSLLSQSAVPHVLFDDKHDCWKNEANYIDI